MRQLLVCSILRATAAHRWNMQAISSTDSMVGQLIRADQCGMILHLAASYSAAV